MADKGLSQTERLKRMLDALAENIEIAPGNEVIEDARLEQKKPDEIAAHGKNVLLQAVKSHQQRELKNAREGYEQEVLAIKARRIELPKQPEVRRTWLAAVLEQLPQLQAAFTIQNRNFSELSDEDVESHLRKLEILGVLKDVRLG